MEQKKVLENKSKILVGTKAVEHYVKTYVGTQIKNILPDPFSLMEGDTDLKEI